MKATGTSNNHNLGRIPVGDAPFTDIPCAFKGYLEFKCEYSRRILGQKNQVAFFSHPSRNGKRLEEEHGIVSAHRFGDCILVAIILVRVDCCAMRSAQTLRDFQAAKYLTDKSVRTDLVMRIWSFAKFKWSKYADNIAEYKPHLSLAAGADAHRGDGSAASSDGTDPSTDARPSKKVRKLAKQKEGRVHNRQSSAQITRDLVKMMQVAEHKYNRFFNEGLTDVPPWVALQTICGGAGEVDGLRMINWMIAYHTAYSKDLEGKDLTDNDKRILASPELRSRYNLAVEQQVSLRTLRTNLWAVTDVVPALEAKMPQTSAHTRSREGRCNLANLLLRSRLK